MEVKVNTVAEVPLFIDTFTESAEKVKPIESAGGSMTVTANWTFFSMFPGLKISFWFPEYVPAGTLEFTCRETLIVEPTAMPPLEGLVLIPGP